MPHPDVRLIYVVFRYQSDSSPHTLGNIGLFGKVNLPRLPPFESLSNFAEYLLGVEVPEHPQDGVVRAEIPRVESDKVIPRDAVDGVVLRCAGIRAVRAVD